VRASVTHSRIVVARRSAAVDEARAVAAAHA
jgi:hypothetical protein